MSYVPFRDGKPDGMLQDVVTGFLLPEEEQVRGRPVGLGIDGTGALLIADDAGNTVWRVAAADGRITDAPVETDRVATDPAAGTADTEGTAPQSSPPAEDAAPTEATPTEPAPAEPAPAN